MDDFFRGLFDASFMPHGHCYRWEPGILWLHALSDGAVVAAYYTIPFLLGYITLKRRDLAYPWMFWMFGAFIVLCGTTHALEIYSIWHGAYRLTGVVKAATGVVSVATAVALVPLVPKVLALVGPGQLREANDRLRAEVVARERAEREVRELARAVAVAEQRERERIAYVLHDDLQQVLVAAKIRGALGDAGRLEETLDEAIEIARTLAHELSPPILREDDVEDLLRWLAAEQHERYGLEVGVEVGRGVSVPSPDLRALLYQVLRELLLNVAKHAGVSEARLTAERGDGYVRVVVEDGGTGFDPSELGGRGMGLPSVRERVELAGGRVDVESEPGAGARVTLTVPAGEAAGEADAGDEPKTAGEALPSE